MSRDGGDNHFLSAKERDLKPLLEEGVAVLDLGERQAWQMEAYLEGAWFSGVRNGHTKLLNQMNRYREDPDCSDPRQVPADPAQMAEIEAEFKEMMEGSAEVLNLSMTGTLALWESLMRAWTAGIHAYEDEVVATLIERESDVTAEALGWLEEDEDS